MARQHLQQFSGRLAPRLRQTWESLHGPALGSGIVTDANLAQFVDRACADREAKASRNFVLKQLRPFINKLLAESGSPVYKATPAGAKGYPLLHARISGLLQPATADTQCTEAKPSAAGPKQPRPRGKPATPDQLAMAVAAEPKAKGRSGGMVTLQDLGAFVDAMRAERSAAARLELLAAWPELHPLLRVVYDPTASFGISSRGLKKALEGAAPEPKSERVRLPTVVETLQALATRKLSGQRALDAMVGLAVRAGPQYAGLLGDMLDKNLRIGVSSASLVKVDTKAAGAFRVALASKYSAGSVKFDADSAAWFWSRKLDGVRCVCLIRAGGRGGEVGSVQYMSRYGRPFTALDHLTGDLLSLWAASSKLRELKPYVRAKGIALDAEVCVNEDADKESFSAAVAGMRRKNEALAMGQVHVFDAIPLGDFDKGRSELPFATRMAAMQAMSGLVTGQVRFVEQERVANDAHFKAVTQRARDQGWEGVILRKDAPYVAKRVHEYVKVKTFDDAEYLVTDVEISNQFMRDDTTGKGEMRPMVASLKVQHKGTTVGVGSGLSQQDRIRFADNPALIIGKQVTVQFFGETYNRKTRTWSLRHPTLKAIYGGEGGRDM